MSVRINSLSKARRLNFRTSVCSPEGEQLSFGVVSVASSKLFMREERKESQPASQGECPLKVTQDSQSDQIAKAKAEHLISINEGG